MSPPEKLLDVLHWANESTRNKNELARDVAVACCKTIEAYAKLSDTTVESTAMALGRIRQLLDRVADGGTLKMAEVLHARDLCEIAERLVVEARPPGAPERKRAPREPAERSDA